MKAAKTEMKLAQQLQEEEMRILFNEGISGQFGKGKKANAEKAAKLGIAETDKHLQQIIDEKFLSDSETDTDSDEENGTYYIDDDEPQAVEGNCSAQL